jgi:hypothetical protein
MKGLLQCLVFCDELHHVGVACRNVLVRSPWSSTPHHALFGTCMVEKGKWRRTKFRLRSLKEMYNFEDQNIDGDNI